MLYRCWCQASWPVSRGTKCPWCGRETDFAPFDRWEEAPGITVEQDEGSSSPIALVDLGQVPPGTYLDDALIVDAFDSPAMRRWAEAHGLPWEEDEEFAKVLRDWPRR